MSKAYLIAGLGFGDEGKGTITQYLSYTRAAGLVVRYNGGAQAAHNVYSRDGKHHTFAQFGSGTLEGARTHLSRFVLVDPHALFNEGRHLISLGISDPYPLLTIDRDALLITPFHTAVNRLRELKRGADRHGSCGFGIGETMSDFLAYGKETSPTMGDLEDPVRLHKKFATLQDLKMDEFRQEIDGDMLTMPMKRELEKLLRPVDRVVEYYAGVADLLNLVGDGFLKKALDGETAVFEGAQGVLLDQNYGFQPYTTWTDTTFGNARILLSEAEFKGEVERVGVTRCYTTRHGSGPFPTEEVGFDHAVDRHNSRGLWQGAFRVGPLDMVLLRYAANVLGGLDSVALTHVDQREIFSTYCPVYRIADEDMSAFTDMRIDTQYGLLANIMIREPAEYEHQRRLGEILRRVKPIYAPSPLSLGQLVEELERELRAPVRVTSSGPLLEDKTDY